tara:strand:+ start:108 stop:839 length:732 start_codon:yes stop_codon:yes gene_type:complete
MEGSKKTSIYKLFLALIVVGLIVWAGVAVWQNYQVKNSDVENLTNQQINEDFKNFNVSPDIELPDWRLKELRENFDAIQQTLLETPDDFFALLGLGQIKKQIGDYKGAEKPWVYLGRQSPRNSTSFGNLGDLYANFIGDYERAEIAYRIAVDNSRSEQVNSIFYRNFYELYLFHLEDPVKARELLTEAVEFNSQNTELLVLLARLEVEQGDLELALSHYDQAINADPSNVPLAQEAEELRLRL